MREVPEILEDVTVCVPNTVEACNRVVPKMFQGILGEEPEK